MNIASQSTEVFVVLVLASMAVLLAGWYRERLLLAIALLVGALLALWVGSLIAFATDFRDADGSLDCWPNCTVYQDTVRTAAVFALPVAAGAGLVALVLAAIGRSVRKLPSD